MCGMCKTEKPFDEFHKKARSKDGYQSRCKRCAIDANVRRYKENKERLVKYQRDYDVKNALRIRVNKAMRLYGLSREDAEVLLAAESCEICGNGGVLHIDHDHETGAVRGVLCLGCNTGLGNFKDSPELMTKGIQYLRASVAQR